MKILSFNAISNLNIDKKLFYDWTKKTISIKKRTVLPLKTSIRCYDNGFVNVMPAIIPSENVYGVKVISRNSKSLPVLKSNLMLFDYKTSNLLATMDAEYITAFRTGACAALSIETLAIKNYKTIGLIGLGNICRATMLVLLSKIKNRHITIKLYMYKNSDKEITPLLKKFKNVDIKYCKTIENTIRDSDVVISCVTYADGNLAKPTWFKKGCLLVPVHTRGFLNCDKIFDRVIVDDIGHISKFQNFSKFKKCYELTDVLNNPNLGRNSNSERILVYNIGLSILDVYFAKRIYELLKGRLKSFPVSEDMQQKLWVK